MPKKKKTKKAVKKTMKTKKKLVRKPKKTARKKMKGNSSSKVSAIPTGYNNVTPYLIVNNASAAIDFYKKVFGAKEVLRMEMQPGRVGHAELRLGDTKIMLADEHPEMNARAPEAFGGSPVSIHLYVKKVDDTVNQALASGATLLRPVEKMFYGDRTGTIQDPFGHKWTVSTHVENVTHGQLRKRIAEMNNKF